MNANSLPSFEKISTHLARTAAAALAMAILLALIIIATPAAQAQTYQVIHSFQGADGSNPYAGLTMDAAGNFYGTTSGGGPGCNPYFCGTVFKMSHNGSGWRLTTLYGFTSSPDGARPFAEVVFGTDGSLYGTTFAGGVATGCSPYTMCGTVFKVRPPATPPRSILDPWTETVLYRFASRALDAFEPNGPLVSDQAGNMYGTTTYGGAYGYGAVYELAPSAGGWTETILHNFSGGSDGRWPYGALIFDHAGNLYGTTWQGGVLPYGTVYELMPSESGWTKKVLYNFTGGSDGLQPSAGLIFDQYGNLYGTTSAGGNLGGGTVFELTPSNRDWVFTLLYSFPGSEWGPDNSLTMDAAGNLYGTTVMDGAFGYGNVFRLTPGSGGWTYASLCDFTGGSDGGWPISNVNFDTKGNLYGTTYLGGDYDGGTVWEITP